MYLNGTMCLDFIKMACPEKTKQLTLLDFHSNKVKLAEAENDLESHLDLKVRLRTFTLYRSH